MRPQQNTQNKIMAQLADLQLKPTEELRAQWQDLFNKPAPRCHKFYLISRLSYRIQELALGGLSERTKTQLEDMVKNKADKGKQKDNRPPVGTELIRRYKGVDHHVTVLIEGFEYQGQNYKSLSKIARKITGTQWNGPLFFGLRGNA